VEKGARVSPHFFLVVVFVRFSRHPDARARGGRFRAPRGHRTRTHAGSPDPARPQDDCAAAAVGHLFRRCPSHAALAKARVPPSHPAPATMDPTPQEAAALAAKKKTKGQKMTLAEFNAAASSRTTSWADEMDSFKPTLPSAPMSSVSLPTGPGSAAGAWTLNAQAQACERNS